MAQNTCFQECFASNPCINCLKQGIEKKFLSWTCGDRKLDLYLKKNQLDNLDNPMLLPIKWIPYEEFENLKLLRRGGEGIIYMATWKFGPLGLGSENVILKCLYSSISDMFLKELDLQVSLYHTNTPLCFGVSQEPTTKNYMIVMEYAEDGDLQRFIRNKFKEFTWKDKLRLLCDVSKTLKIIHNAGLVHGDLHSGNILKSNNRFYISDFGLCRPFCKTTDPSKLCGVLPYVAPEVLNSKSHGPEADIYGFGMIMWEITSGKQPYESVTHNFDLAQDIIAGSRPPIVHGAPKEIVDLIKRCWNDNPIIRPSAAELSRIFENWIIVEKFYEKWDADECVLFYDLDVEGENEEKFKQHTSQDNNTLNIDYISMPIDLIVPDEIY
ncbi:12079_t:CDS:2 [Cetraspora pellucida]|uniref:12079_t:CDS:1 n=1 Tax=Cetraspora pellucida TaxID=1433469 RepID=A0ACA9JYR5_9GLOM|nr:12079_t:CDS:2 [Cetraspora pellucida]